MTAPDEIEQTRIPTFRNALRVQERAKNIAAAHEHFQNERFHHWRWHDAPNEENLLKNGKNTKQTQRNEERRSQRAVLLLLESCQKRGYRGEATQRSDPSDVHVSPSR